MPKDQVELSLQRLQKLIRLGEDEASGSGFHFGKVVPNDLASDAEGWLSLTRREHAQMQEVEGRLLSDLRFEHLGDGVISPLQEAVWRFICLCALREGDHVEQFMSEHARAPLEHQYWFPVEYLAVSTPLSLLGVRFLPLGDPEVPDNPHLYLGRPTASILRVVAVGTSGKRTHGRARALAQHSLAILRVGMRVDNQVTDEQLRFRLGVTYGVGDRFGGWGIDPSTPFEVGLSQSDVEVVVAQPLADVSLNPETDIDKHAVIALEWLDLARLTPDRLNATLFAFFALEAILGDASEGTKASGLTFRAAFLAHLDVGHFQDPGVVYWLYDEVRSAAVHGSARPELPDRDFYWFDRTVRETLNRVIVYCRETGIARQSDLVRSLHEHPEAADFMAWLGRDPRWTNLR